MLGLFLAKSLAPDLYLIKAALRIKVANEETTNFRIADNLGAISPGNFGDTPLARMARFSAKWMSIRYWHETLCCLLTRTVVHKLIRRCHRCQRLPARQ
jgi:hypothetical protein